MTEAQKGSASFTLPFYTKTLTSAQQLGIGIISILWLVPQQPQLCLVHEALPHLIGNVDPP